MGQCSSVSDLARLYLEQASKHPATNNAKEIVLIGYSFGVIIAGEMALQLQQQQQLQLRALILIDMQVEWPFQVVAYLVQVQHFSGLVLALPKQSLRGLCACLLDF